MRIKVLVEHEVWIDVDEFGMKASELLSLRDTEPRKYDRIVDSAFDKAIVAVAEGHGETCTTLLEVED